MSTVHADAIVVGVDGSRGSLKAVDYAVHEGHRIGAHVRLVHVVPSYSAMAPAPMMVLPPSDLVETGRTILDRALAHARAAAGGLFVQAELRRGSRSRELAAAARDAKMLVVGRDSRSAGRPRAAGRHRGWGCLPGNVPRRDGASLLGPGRGEGSGRGGRQVVGARRGSARRGFAAASSLGARLLVVHAWKLPSAYDDIVVSRVAEQEWAEQGANELGAVLEPYEARHPGVEVTVRVTHSYANHALEQASRQADLLVLARRAHGFPAAAHLGGTARHLLRNAECPVLVVAPLPHGGSDARHLEHAGHQGQ